MSERIHVLPTYPSRLQSFSLMPSQIMVQSIAAPKRLLSQLVATVQKHFLVPSGPCFYQKWHICAMQCNEASRRCVTLGNHPLDKSDEAEPVKVPACPLINDQRAMLHSTSIAVPSVCIIRALQFWPALQQCCCSQTSSGWSAGRSS